MNIKLRLVGCVLIASVAGIQAADRSMQPLHEAAGAGNFALMQSLIAENADVNARTTTTGGTPLHFAVYKGGVECAKLLVESNADPLLADSSGTTVLMQVIKAKSVRVSAIPENEMTAFIESFEALFNYLCDVAPDLVTRTNKEGKSPLSIALQYFDEQAVVALNSRGALISDEGREFLEAKMNQIGRFQELLLNNNAD